MRFGQLALLPLPFELAAHYLGPTVVKGEDIFKVQQLPCPISLQFVYHNGFV